MYHHLAKYLLISTSKKFIQWELWFVKKKGNAAHIISAHDKLLHAQKLVFLYPLYVHFL